MCVVLVVDDSSVQRAYMRQILEGLGIRVLLADDGVEGVRMARKHRPDIVFMDVQMPEMDGIAATGELMKMPETMGTRVIMVSAVDTRADRLRSMMRGAVDFLPKPVGRDELCRVLKANLDARMGSKIAVRCEWSAGPKLMAV